MNSYEKIYSLLIETVTVKTKEKPTQLARRRPERDRLEFLWRLARHAGKKAGKALVGGEIGVRQAVDAIGGHEKRTAHHGGGTTRARREYTKGMKIGARKK